MLDAYVARDNDPAGNAAVANLITRSISARIEAIILSPRLADFNEDIRTLGIDALRAAIRVQIVPEDDARFIGPEMSDGKHPPSSASLRPFASLRVQVPSARRRLVAMKAAMGAVDPTKGSTP